MALRLQDMVPTFQALSPVKLDTGGDMSMERQKLKLMLEQFEETKRKNAEDESYRRMAEAGEMTRARMQTERQAAQAQALAQAETVKQRREAYGDVYKYEDAGDIEGMENAANRLNESGGLAERLGEDANGMPTWRVNTDAEKYRAEQANREATLAPGAIETPAYTLARDEEDPGVQVAADESLHSSLSRMGALGYGKLNTRGNLNETAPGAAEPLSTEQAFRRAQGAAQGPEQQESPQQELAEPVQEPTEQELAEQDAAQNFAVDGSLRPDEMTISPRSTFERTGKPARGPDPADLMGGVPNDVIDTGAMAAHTQQRLGPVMADIERSMPQAYQAETAANNRAALGAGLSGPKALEQSLALRAPADAATARELGAERDLSKEEREAERKAIEAAKVDPLKEEKLVDIGSNRAWKAYDKLKIHDSVGVMEGADQVVKMLEDNDAANDDKAVNLMMDLAKQVGAQSDADAMRMTGGKISTWGKVSEWIHEQFSGGYGDEVAASMREFAKDMRNQQRRTVFGWIRSVNEDADSASHPLVAQGYKKVVSKLPEWLRDEYDADVDAEGGAAPAEPPSTGDEKAGPAADDTDFTETLNREAEDKDVDPAKMLTIMGPESGGDPAAKNKHSSASGIIQMMDSTAQRYTNPRTGEKFKDAGELRGLSKAEQAPIAAQYFHDSGVTKDSPVEDYALAVAAPAFVGRSAERDAVVYPKGSKEHTANRPWWPADGGDITVGSIIDLYVHGDKKAEAPKKTASAGRKGSGDAKLLEGI